MRTVLLGTDFMYNSVGNLVPIEINTNVGMDFLQRIEDDDSVFNLTELSSFITNNNFTKIVYIGGIKLFHDKLNILASSLNLEYVFHKMNEGITIPYVEDDATTLIIRSAYDTTALVDEEYCKVKTNFLSLIKNEQFGSQFAYMDIDNNLINNISTFKNNGNHPNFILKSIYPKYNKDIYPKLYKVTNQSELESVLQNVTYDKYLTEFYYNPNKLYENHMKVVRSLNLLFPPNLNSIPIGTYNKLVINEISENCTYDPTTFELLNTDRSRYLTTVYEGWHPKLLDTDLVEMEDCSFKTALDLQVGDMVKTIIIPGEPDLTTNVDTEGYSITYDELVSGTTYSSNRIIGKVRVNKFTQITTINFTDNTVWEDTNSSKYLIVRDGLVIFKNIDELLEFDEVILINPQNCNEINFTKKTVSSVSSIKTFFGGWEITVEDEHLFLTKTTEDINSYVAIEHNLACLEKSCTPGPAYEVGGCTNYCAPKYCCINGACMLNLPQ